MKESEVKFKITRRKPVPGEWEVDSTTLEQWKNENRLLPYDEIYIYQTNKLSYAKALYPALFRAKILSSRNLVLTITLLPLIFFVALFGVLGMWQHNRKLAGSKVEITKARIETLKAALEKYKENKGAYPTTEQGLTALAPPRGSLVKKEYISDGWGRDFFYFSPGRSGGPIEVISYGADGRPGGLGPDADISN